MTLRTYKASTTWSLALVAGVLGVIIGYGIAGFDGGDRDRPSNTGSATGLQSPGDSAPARAGAGPVVAVDVSRGRPVRMATTRGVLVRDPVHRSSRLLLPLSVLYEALKGEIRAGADRVPPGPVVAIHPDAGLALLETGLSVGGALSAPDSGALYLGLELEAVSVGSSVRASVETAALERNDGQPIYGVRMRAPPPSGLTALVSNAGELAGVLTGRRLDGGLYEAIDAYALSQMAPPPGGAGIALSGFSEVFFDNTPAGRRMLFYAAAESGDWARVLQTAPAVLDARPGDTRVQQIVERACLHRVQALMEQNKPGRALALIDETEALLPGNIELLTARAGLLSQTGRHEQAARVLLTVMDGEPPDQDMRRRLRRQLASTIDAEALSPTLRQRLWQGAVNYDAAYAPYHAELGNALYDQRRYADALSRWNYAAQLDPTLHGDLDSRMNSARRHLSPSRGIVVPLIGDGRSYFVDAELNNRPRRLLLDTGASYSAISPELARTLGIDYADGARRVRLSTANGVITAPLVRLERINLNGAMVNDLDAVVLERLDGPGVLGLNFLNHFNIDINQADAQMTLRR